MLNLCQEHYCPRDQHTFRLILRPHFVNPQLNGPVWRGVSRFWRTLPSWITLRSRDHSLAARAFNGLDDSRDPGSIRFASHTQAAQLFQTPKYGKNGLSRASHHHYNGYDRPCCCLSSSCWRIFFQLPFGESCKKRYRLIPPSPAISPY